MKGIQNIDFSMICFFFVLFIFYFLIDSFGYINKINVPRSGFIVKFGSLSSDEGTTTEKKIIRNKSSERIG